MTSLETEPDITISAPAEITASNVNAFRTLATSRLQLGGTQLSVDLSATSFIDSSGLGDCRTRHCLVPVDCYCCYCDWRALMALSSSSVSNTNCKKIV